MLSELWSSGRIRSTTMATEVAGPKWWCPEEPHVPHGQGFPASPPPLSWSLLCVSWCRVCGQFCRRRLGVAGPEKWASLSIDQQALMAMPLTSPAQGNWASIATRKATHRISSPATHPWERPRALTKLVQTDVYLASVLVHMDFTMDLCLFLEKACIPSVLSSLC